MAEDTDPDSKTEDPTGKRLSDARQKGQVPKTQELNHLFMMGTALALLLLVFPWSFGRISMSLMPFIQRPHDLSGDLSLVAAELTGMLVDVALALAIPFALLLMAPILASVVQVGWLITTEQVFKFDLSRLNPVTGLLNKFKLRNLVEFAKSLVKLAVVGVVVAILLMPLWNSIEYFIALPLETLVIATRNEAAKLIFGVLMVLIVIAGIDYMYQKFEFTKQMRMTKQEVKDEFKQMEGDPLVKAKLRELRIRRAQSRMMANVPRADVVVTNPTHYAVALKYDPQTMGAPMVLAKGVDFLALKIREIAEENGIPILSNPPLARALYATAEVDEEVPPEHYKAVAQVISYVFKLKRRPIPN